MRICLISSEHSTYGGIGNAMRRLATTLAHRHDVTLVYGGGIEVGKGDRLGFRSVPAAPSPGVAALSFASEDHLRSAAVLEAIEAAYGDGEGPEYVEVNDYRAPGLVPLQARRAGHPLLRGARFGIRMSGSAELIALHDGRGADPAEERVAELEREQFRLADRLLAPSPEILDLYERHYVGLDLPDPVLMSGPFAPPERPPEVRRRGPGEPLRILYVGRLQRLKGVLNLVDACLRLSDDSWELTLIGADTETAPMRQSVRLSLEAMCGGDPRVRLEDVIPHGELQRRFHEHDLLVVSSTFEVFPNVALEAMRAGLPVLATATAGLGEIVEPGVSGWVADGVGRRSLSRALSELLEAPEEVERVRASGAVHERFLALTDPERALAAYDELLASPRPVRPAASIAPSGPPPTVTAVIPYYRCPEYVEEAVGSLLGQTYPGLDVLIVDDGSFDPADEVLDRLGRDPRVRVVTQLNSGDATARNLGIALSTADYLVMFDADNILEPEFVERALAMLRADPELAYVTCWLRFIDPDGEPLEGGNGFAPLGNRVLAGEEENWDGDTIALFPGEMLRDLGPDFRPNAVMHSDWDLYRRLRSEGRFGAVIPERLARYRIRPDSMLRGHDVRLHRRSWDEQRSWRRLAALQTGRSGG